MLKEYAENNGYPNLRYYVDDGYTGTNFNRPDFQRMMEDVENGIIETIVVKDMSRFGRNYILVCSMTQPFSRNRNTSTMCFRMWERNIAIIC